MTVSDDDSMCCMRAEKTREERRRWSEQMRYVGDTYRLYIRACVQLSVHACPTALWAHTHTQSYVRVKRNIAAAEAPFQSVIGEPNQKDL